MNRFFAVIPLLLPAILLAHTGSPDVVLEASAGPYPLSIYVKTPRTIPGVAEVEIRSDSKDLRSMQLVQTLVTGAGRVFFPRPEVMRRSRADSRLFTGSLWMMAEGSWKLRVSADGDRGAGELYVPVPAAMRRTSTMGFFFGVVLASLGLALVLGAASIAGASVREGQLLPGAVPSRSNVMDARLFMAAATTVVCGLLIGGNSWWNSEAGRYKSMLYDPLSLSLDVHFEGNLVAATSSRTRPQSASDIISDCGYFMNMYVVSIPTMEKMYHLHPEMQVAGVFTTRLPAMDAGKYRVFGDIVHANGFPETVTGEFELKAALRGEAPVGDDSQASAPPAGRNPDPGFSALSDKYRMVMVRGNNPVKAREVSHFTFRVESKSGRAAEDLELIMGMPADAAFVKHDRSVFAHLHPMGTAPAAAIALVSSFAAKPKIDRSSHSLNLGLPAEVTFPYAVPSPGDYRIYVQVKRAGKIETGTFDLTVTE